MAEELQKLYYRLNFNIYLPLPNIFGLLAGLKHMLCRIRSARCWLIFPMEKKKQVGRMEVGKKLKREKNKNKIKRHSRF
uniref:Uncharacterized protein n=1 Tax=Serinus canaria TaxID=9135 RepID=A0A8C9MZL5_SERCA